MAANKHLSEIRICPECEMSAHRMPSNDVGKQLAFQCDNGHLIFLATAPSVKKAVVVKGHTVKAVVVLATPAPAKAKPKKSLVKDAKRAAKPKKSSKWF